MEKILLLSLFFLILSCNQQANSDVSKPKSKKDKKQIAVIAKPVFKSDLMLSKQMAKKQNMFGFQLLKKMIDSKQQDNVLISPPSIAFALGMCYNGAAGSTRQAIARAISLTGMKKRQVNRGNLSLKNCLEKANDKIELKIANSLWMKAGINYKAKFIRQTKKFYQAQLSTLDFNSPKAKDAINQWVSAKTNKKITKIVDSIPKDAILYLLNAVYFKGQWKTYFEKERSYKTDFKLLNGKTKKQAMMSQSGSYQYLSTPEFQAINLPYGGSDVSMYIFLPSNFKSFLHNLSESNWNKWLKKFKEKEGEIGIPKFKLEYESFLTPLLADMGMEEAFSKQADFSNIRSIPPAIFIKEIKHKSYMEVNEKGTEAAAVTSVGFGIEAVQEKFEFFVESPFFFAIRDNITGSVLFLGIVTNPSQ